MVGGLTDIAVSFDGPVAFLRRVEADTEFLTNHVYVFDMSETEYKVRVFPSKDVNFEQTEHIQLKRTDPHSIAVPRRFRLPFRHRPSGLSGRSARRPELAATMPLRSVRRATVGHRIHSATHRKRSLLAVPYPTVGGARTVPSSERREIATEQQLE